MSNVDEQEEESAPPQSSRARGGDSQQQPTKKSPGVKVSEYKRSDGTKVSNHKRSAPSRERDEEGQREGDDEEQPPTKKGPTMTIDEFLAKPWVEKIAQQIDNDPDKAALAEKDAAAAHQYQTRGNALYEAYGGEQRGSLGGLKEFSRALDQTLHATGFTNEKGVAIMRQFKEGFYQDDSGVIQTRILVPHLGDAGLDQLAMDVMAFRYVL